MKNGTDSASLWSTLTWLCSTVTIVLGAPYVICRALCHVRQLANRDALPGKVFSMANTRIYIEFCNKLPPAGRGNHWGQLGSGRGDGALVLSSRLQSGSSGETRRRTGARSQGFDGNSFGACFAKV